IVEIAYHKVSPSGREETKSIRINPEVHIPEASSAIHGIYDADVADCPTFKSVAKEITRDIEGCDLAGYNSNRFDIPLLAEELLRAEVDVDLMKRKFVDVQVVFHKMEQRTLGAAYKFYCKKELTNAHSAEADTLATYEILKSQLDRYANVTIKDRKGNWVQPIVNDIKALCEFSYANKAVDLVGHIVYNDKNTEVFNFGKHKGKAVVQVFRDEPSYYDWMMKGEFPRSTKKVITSLKLKGFNNESVKLDLH
ncbi:MAG: exonuclease domain-containing protein, partial [Bacteroidota bacterium]